ncbi:hypothetical protein [Adhaeribacter pallidiroseus]|nr:hypothetical protein [Adhaeribacter pallidiroseus]
MATIDLLFLLWLGCLIPLAIFLYWKEERRFKKQADKRMII